MEKKMGHYRVVILSLCTLSLLFVSGHPHEEEVSHNVDHESHLSFHLMDHYVKDLRPAANGSDPVHVAIKLSVLNINGPIAWTNFVKMTFLLKMSWHDPRLKWNVTDYSGLKMVSLSSDRIWQPQLSPLESEILNSGHGPEEVATVYHSGDVEVLHTEKAHLHCIPFDVNNFPADALRCSVTLLSTAYRVHELNIHIDKRHGVSETFDASLGNVEENGWRLEKDDTAFKAIVKGLGISGKGQPGVQINLVFRRTSNFYWSIFVVPSTLLAILVPLAFMIPAGTNAKPLFGLSVAIGEIILLVGLNQIWPHVSRTPNIGLFCISTTVLACLATMVSVVLNSLFESRRFKTVPQWLKSLCFGRCGIRRLVCLDDYSPVGGAARLNGLCRNDSTLIESESMPANDQGARTNTEPAQPEIIKNLQLMVTRLGVDDMRKRIKGEWREVIRVLDRVCFIVFFVMFLTTAFALLA